MRKHILIFGLICYFTSFSAKGQSPTDSLLSIISNQSDTTLIKSLLELSDIYAKDNSTLDSSVIYGLKAYNTAKGLNLNSFMAQAAYSIGYAYDLKSELSNALQFYETARLHYHEIDDRSWVATCMNGKGVACYFQGDYSRALSFYLEALEYERENDLKHEEANTLNNIGVIYRITEKYDEAIEIFNQNVKLRKELKDSTNLARIYNNLGVVYTYSGEYEKVHPYLDSSLQIYQELGDKYNEANIYITSGDAYLMEGKNLEKARNALMKGYEIMRPLNDHIHLPKCLLFLGKVDNKLGNYRQAVNWIDEGIELLKDTELDDIKKDLLYESSVAYENIGNQAMSLSRLKSFTQLNTQLNSSEKLEYMEEMQAKYETEKKEKEIALLNSENQITELRLKNSRYINYGLGAGLILLGIMFFILYRLYDKIRKQKEIISNNLKEKELLLDTIKKAKDKIIKSEKLAAVGQLTAGIAHEINNPINYISNSAAALAMNLEDLGSIQTLLRNKKQLNQDLTLDEIKNIIDELDLHQSKQETQKLIEGIISGAERTSNLVKSLKYISYSDKAQKEEIDIHEAIDSSLDVLLSQFKERVTIHKSYGDLPYINVFAGQINQVFLNILVNAFQAIDGLGNVWINTYTKGNEVSIEIKDDGRGIPPTIIHQIFDPFFTTKDIGEGTGLGLSICHGIIENHGGHIEVDSEEGKGSSFLIILPIS